MDFNFKKILAAAGLCLWLLQPAVGWSAEKGETWRNLSPKQRENVIKNYRRWQNLPQQDKERLREQWDRWQNLPQDRRDQLKNRYNEMRRRRQNDD